jgi:Icc-related predicted phosphoesterase
LALFGKKTRTPSADQTLSLYYASDVHGFYGVQALIMGGDLTGKAIVPIERNGNGHFSASFLGEVRSGDTQRELDELMDAARYNGMYPWLATNEEIVAHSGDLGAQSDLFDKVIVDELRRWIALADERMSQYGIGVYVMPGNDDPWSCDAVIEEASHVVACDDRVVQVGPHEMISCAYANPTPWDSPRECDEAALYDRIKRLADQVEAPHRAIFNLHVPPYDSGLDTAREINPDLTVVYKSGAPHEIPVGSTAVRQIIEEYQPALALHGHIHESRGEAQIGRTLAINSGSEYNSGRIHGVTVALGGDRVLSHQFVIG